MKRSILPITLSVLLAAFSAVGCSGCGSGGGKSSGYNYTYNTYLATNPKTWNVHNWETSDESYVPAFTEMGLYDLQFNADKTGYEIITEMAAAMPVDVTSSLTDAEFAKYGYSGNPDEGYVWEIALNQAAVWEDGKPINADTYIESMKRQLDPEMVNFRADSYYAGSLVLANAERYFKQGRNTMEEAYKYLDKNTGISTDDNFCPDGYWFINLTAHSSFENALFGEGSTEGFYDVLDRFDFSDAGKLASKRILDGVSYYVWKYCDKNAEVQQKWTEKVTEYKDLATKVDSDMVNFDINLDNFDDPSKPTYARKTVDNPVTQETDSELYTQEMLKSDIKKVVAEVSSGLASKDWRWKAPLFAHYFNNDKVDFDNVGIAKKDDYTIKLFLSKPITALDLKFSLTGNWIVDVEKYDALTKTTSGGLKSTTYATPTGGVEGYSSYGPYKLVAYEDGKSFNIVKNDKWYGYTDGKHVGQYQMDSIYTRIIQEHQTAKQEFLIGNLDDFDLNADDMRDYGNSSRLTQTYESYTTKISFNSDRAKLLSRQKAAGDVNKTVLANINFRKGLSLALNRNLFASQTTAGSKGFTGLLNSLYLTDVEAGEMYRNTAQGKGVYNAVYGELGPGGGALPESECGYNFDLAAQCVAQAFQEEIADSQEGHLVANSKISLYFPVYDDQSDTTKKMLAFLRDSFEKVVAKANELAGTSVTIEIQSQKDEDYYTTCRKGETEMIFSTWGGAAIAPIGLMQVYCDSTFDNCCEFGFKGKQNETPLSLDTDGDGVLETKSFNSWWTEINEIVESGDKSSEEYKKQHNRILTILAGLEAGILNRYEAVPVYARATSAINSYKIENGSSTYINLIGYGGVRHMTFNYTNAEWEQFLAENKDRLVDLYKA